MTQRSSKALAILNGLVGDHLHSSRNPLAIPFGFYSNGQPVVLETAGIQHLIPGLDRRLVVFVHGIMTTESYWQPTNGDSFGKRLTHDFGVQCAYVRYNTGRPIAENGAALAQALADLTARHSIEELVLVGYSMGGLLVRHALEIATTANLPWLTVVQKVFYLGTPHGGTHYERAGRTINLILDVIPDPVTRLIGNISNLRSRGIKDLGDPATIRAPSRIKACLIAGDLGIRGPLGKFLGDGTVPVSSATRLDGLGDSNSDVTVKVLPGMSHTKLPKDKRVYEVMRDWLISKGWRLQA